MTDLQTRAPERPVTDRPRTDHTRRMRPLRIAAIVGAVVVLAGTALIVGSTVYAHTHPAAPPGPTFEARGTVVIPDCEPVDQAVIAADTRIRVTDEAKRTLGQGQLQQVSACEWTFTVPGVLAGRSMYGLAIGGSGVDLKYTEEQMRDGLTITFGGS